MSEDRKAVCGPRTGAKSGMSACAKTEVAQ